MEEAAAAFLVEQALDQQPEVDAEELTASADGVMIAEMPYPVSAGEGGDTPVGDVALPPAQDAIVSDASLSNAPVSASAKPAAQWDRATDAVRSDWSAIERTAAHDGPNQAMAELLVAARGEDVNSRWPL